MNGLKMNIEINMEYKRILGRKGMERMDGMEWMEWNGTNGNRFYRIKETWMERNGMEGGNK